jgi:hypothetical protein
MIVEDFGIDWTRKWANGQWSMVNGQWSMVNGPMTLSFFHVG